MKGVNKAIVLGNIGHTPDLKTTEGGTEICKLTLATNRKYKGETETTWHNIVAFGKAAELIGQYVSKGDLLYVEGRISNTSYIGKDDVRKYRSEIICSEFCFMPRGQEVRGEQRSPEEAKSDLRAISEGLKANGIKDANKEPSPASDIPYDDKIPF